MITVQMNFDELDAIVSVVSNLISKHDKGEKIAATYAPETIELLRNVEKLLQPFYYERVGKIEVTPPPLNIR